ncbi:YgjP-like metallopeptidase domain-containing protein [Metamycoplasma auris]|uniref:YgjP-like metallopeptidase domain-containing protein n=1 Tax=Metamycoplasma auris TaxID=51363 RepID=A0A2W7G0Z0_9BACT|nr:YgjP-like metallopeptidase domain-containing protein [Metamycoplasma auris]PZV99876.1 hypothetical protein BCF89_1054 [Metamycoplasma auris]
MKKPDAIIKQIIDNTEYQIKFFYTNAKHVYLTYEDGFFIVRGKFINLHGQKFENFLINAMNRILSKKNKFQKQPLEIDTINQQFYYFGKLCKYIVVRNEIIIQDEDDNPIKTIKYHESNKSLDVSEIIKKEIKNELVKKFNLLATEAAKQILNKEINFKYSVHKKKTSWASIIVQKNKINLCIDLMYFDPQIIRYVAYHEVSHIVYQNHSPKFWLLVVKYIPDYKILKNKLKNHIFK